MSLQGLPQRNLHQLILSKVASSRMLVLQLREWLQIWGKVLLCASPGLTFEGPGASKTPPKFQEKTLRERKRAKMGAGEGNKARNFGPTAFGLPPFRPPRCAAAPFGPNPCSPNFFQVWAPSGGGPPGLHFFWVWAPTFLIFYHVAHLFFLCIFNSFNFL